MSKSNGYSEVFVIGMMLGVAVGALLTGKSVSIPLTINETKPPKSKVDWTFDQYWDWATGRCAVVHTDFTLDLEASSKVLLKPYVYRNQRVLTIEVPSRWGTSVLLITKDGNGISFADGPMSSIAYYYKRHCSSIYEVLRHIGKSHLV